jgi:predicted secreted protein
MGEETAVRKVKVGQKFTIDLEAMPGAGFMWELAEIPSQLELVHQGIISTSKEIGGSSTQRFTLVAHQPGTYSLSFAFKRKWEKSAAKTAVFSVDAN